MKKLTKLLFSLLLLSAFTITHADKPGCWDSCCNDCCWDSCCNDCCWDSCCGNRGKSCCPCECTVQSRSTFVIRPQFQVGSPEYLTAYRDRMDAAGECGRGGALQVVLFGGRSTKPGKLASFFTPDCKTCLLAKSNNLDCKTDLIIQHFNIDFECNGILNDLRNTKDVQECDPVFESTICFCPRVKTFGLGLTYRQNLNKLRDCYDPCERHIWLEISTPLTRVETTMGLTERVTSTETIGLKPNVVEGLDQTFYTNMKDAFRQSAWKYGKINGCCGCSETRLGDISLMLGWETAKCDSCILEGYFGFLIPTGNKRCGTYVFEPMVGHDRHWGIIKGFHLRVDLWEDEDCCRKLEIAHDSHGLYLFKKEEMRSFDLKCKPWSRYMEVYKNKEQAEMADSDILTPVARALLSTPGINVFTKCLCVRPKLSITLNTAAIYSSPRFRAELGYNFYAKQAECVELCNWNETAALKDAFGSGITNRFRTINVNASIDPEVDRPPCDPCAAGRGIDKYEENVIKKSDIDLESATHPGYFSNTLYGSIGTRRDCKERPIFVDIGASYEFGCENVVLNRWTAWAKFGASF
ncbi:hypothetical protein ACFLYA_02695 [Candidatus Dependentiae bacterium]